MTNWQTSAIIVIIIYYETCTVVHKNTHVTVYIRYLNRWHIIYWCKKITMIEIKITREHKVIVSKTYQFKQQTNRSFLNIRKYVTMTFNKVLLWHKHPSRYKITVSPVKQCAICCSSMHLARLSVPAIRANKDRIEMAKISIWRRKIGDGSY